MSTLPDFEALAFSQDWTAFGSDANRGALFRRILPGFLAHQRWFSGKEHGIGRVVGADRGMLPGHDIGYQISLWTVEAPDGSRQRYLLPLAVAWESGTGEAFPSAILPFTLASVRDGERIGVLFDALAGETFPADVVRAFLRKQEVPTAEGARIVFTPTRTLSKMSVPAELPVERLGREQSNTSVRVGGTMILKVYRRLAEGIHPEVEIGRFLTEVVPFPNMPPLLGSIDLLAADGTPTALGVLQGFVPNQGDGWGFTLDYLEQALERRATGDDGLAGPDPYLARIGTLGRRVAELHLAFATPVADPAFAPESLRAADLKAWEQAARRQAVEARNALARALPRLAPGIAREVEDLLAEWTRIERLIGRSLPASPAGLGLKTRHHGDLHLGQVVLAGDDFHILDFEGEPAKPLAIRRAKHSPLRDVAGMLRSLDYAARSAAAARASVRPEAAAGELGLLDAWEASSSSAFLEGYFERAGDLPSLPGAPEARRRLLDLFVLEKALYEICYEAANRPAWLSIPVRGIRRLLMGKGTK